MRIGVWLKLTAVSGLLGACGGDTILSDGGSAGTAGAAGGQPISAQAGTTTAGYGSTGGSAGHAGGLSGSLGGALDSGGDGATDGGAAGNAEAGAGGAAPDTCPDGEFEHDGTSHCWSTCLPGQYVAYEGTKNTDRVCTACDEGTFSDVQNASACRLWWTTCFPGQYVTPGSATASAERQCSSCAPGSFSSSIDAPMCNPWKTCPPDSPTWPEGVVATVGTASSDTVCHTYYDFSSDFQNTATGVTVDSGGSAYVVGTQQLLSLGGDFDMFVRKFDAHGAILWTQQFGTSRYDWPTGFAIDGNRNSYVSGLSSGPSVGTEGASLLDSYLRKFDANGVPLWTRQIGVSGNDSAFALAVDSGGNAYVAGSFDAGGSAQNAYVRKFDASGATLWMQQFGESAQHQAQAVAVDASGNVYVGGVINDQNPDTPYSLDAFVRKFSSSGESSWALQFGTTSADDQIVAAAVDGNGDLYVAGTTGSALEGSKPSSSSDKDAFVRKYDASGATLWTRQIGSSSLDETAALALDTSNNVYLVGSAFGTGLNAGSADVYVRKFDASGVTLWTKQFGTDDLDAAVAAAVDAAGNLYIAGIKDTGGIHQRAFLLRIPPPPP